MEPQQTPLARAIAQAGGMTALARKLNERGHKITGHATVYQWAQVRVPADYCPDIEAITGVRCEDLRPDVNWSVLRQKAEPSPDSGERRRATDVDGAEPKAA